MLARHHTACRYPMCDSQFHSWWTMTSCIFQQLSHCQILHVQQQQCVALRFNWSLSQIHSGMVHLMLDHSQQIPSAFPWFLCPWSSVSLQSFQCRAPILWSMSKADCWLLSWHMPLHSNHCTLTVDMLHQWVFWMEYWYHHAWQLLHLYQDWSGHSSWSLSEPHLPCDMHIELTDPPIYLKAIREASIETLGLSLSVWPASLLSACSLSSRSMTWSNDSSSDT